MKVVEGDLLDVTEGLIAHQVNCRGVMGAGVARVIARRYPEVEAHYREHCRNFEPLSLLGTALLSPTDTGLIVANIFGQLDTGRGLQTDYRAVADALDELSRRWGASELPTMHVPYMMGCGLAGGDWDVYSELLDEHWVGGVVALRLPSR